MNLDHVIAVRSKKTIYRDGNMAIKVFDRDYLRTDVLNEALNRARAEKTDCEDYIKYSIIIPKSHKNVSRET